jgi:hypothetical protein
VTWREQITGALTVSLRAARPFGQSRGSCIKVHCADFSGNATNTFALVLAPAIR